MEFLLRGGRGIGVPRLMAREVRPARPERRAADERRAGSIQREGRVDPRQVDALRNRRIPEPAFQNIDLGAESVVRRQVVYSQRRPGFRDLRIFASSAARCETMSNGQQASGTTSLDV